MPVLQEEMAALSPQKRQLLLSLLAKQGLEPSRLPILPSDRNARVFPLSLPQRRMWLLHRAEARSLYNTTWNVLLRGALDRGALARSLTTIVERHQTLRTCFPLVDGAPAQVISPAPVIEPPEVDLSGLPRSRRQGVWRQLALREARWPFDFEVGPILRSTLVRIDGEEHVLLITTHHIVSDGWSSGIFFGELRAAYEAFAAGSKPLLPPLPIQYVDFASWQQQWLDGRVLAEQAAYWRDQLAGLPLEVTLPADRPHQTGVASRGRTFHRAFTDLPSGRLKALGKPSGASLFTVLVAALGILVSRYSGELDVPIGSPVANRDRREVESLIGFFLNTLVLRVDLSPNPTFRQLLSQVRGTVLGATSHQDLPFDRVVEELRVRRQPGVHPLFQVALMMQVPGSGTYQAGGLEISRLLLDDELARFDLEVHTWEGKHGLESFWTYDQNRFDGATMVRVAAHFARLLERLTAEPDLPIGHLSLLSEAEHHAIVREWNDTAAGPPFKPLHGRFEAWARRTPHRQALVFAGKAWSYRTLNRRANGLARRLRRAGVGPDVVVGIAMPRSPELILAILAVLKAGGAFLPLSPDYPAERLRTMLRDSRTEHLVTLDGALSHAGELPGYVLDLARHSPPEEAAETADLGLPILPDQLAYMLYTSGSTGEPKGVLLRHLGLSNLAQMQGEQLAVGNGARVLQFASCSFDVFVWEIAMALTTGAALAITASANLLPGPTLEATLQALRITHVILPPTALNLVSPERLRALTDVFSIGEACTAQAAAPWVDGRRFWNAYGPTEATVYATVERCLPGEPITIGRPLPDFAAVVLDAGLCPVPIGVVGELALGGPGLARGYYRRPALTAARFVPSPFADRPGERLYWTGDLVRQLAGGEIQFLGRADRQVKIHGFRIELGEVEATLLRHPAVREVAVLDREDQGNRRLAAYLVAAVSGEALVGPLKAWTRARLPAHEVPTLWFVLERMPVTINGKVDRKALAALEAAPLRPEQELELPRTPLEARIAGVWMAVLGLPRVGIRDNFFDLGGDSILAIRVIAELRGAGFTATPQELFDHPTVADLAQVGNAAPAAGLATASVAPGLVAIRATGSKPPLFCFPGGGGNTMYLYPLVHHLDAERPFFAFAARGLDGQGRPHETIAEMAVDCLQALRRVQPHGPYLLGGHSFGAWAAFHAAWLLRQQGEEVAGLVVFDTPAPLRGNLRRRAGHDELDDGRWLRGIAQLVKRVTGKPLPISDEALAALSIDSFLPRFRDHLEAVHLLPPGSDLGFARGGLEVAKANTRALLAYRLPGWLDVAVHLLHAEQMHPDDAEVMTPATDRDWGWSCVTSGEVSVRIVPGDHLTMFSPALAPALARELDAALDRGASKQRGSCK
ncbi:MAG TPA: amino acid adenylation domain-containing protein [Thermoanaerobaculia bacterium]|nr:amino acid adenylation domain-containing protein [Thermoanaerobaculia bacterium]